MNRLLLSALLLGTLSLTACSDKPFEKKSSDEVAMLLMNASLSMMREMHLPLKGGSSRYEQCMATEGKVEFDCERLYQGMIVALKAQGLNVRVSDIKDKALFARIRDDLKQRSYFSF